MKGFGKVMGVYVCIEEGGVKSEGWFGVKGMGVRCGFSHRGWGSQ